MSQDHTDDFVSFLRNHRPCPPPPQGDLEKRLMAQIQAEPPTKKPVKSFFQLGEGLSSPSLSEACKPRQRLRLPQRKAPALSVGQYRWAFSSLMAASVFLMLTSLLPSTPSQQNAQLEAFLTENWEAVTTTSPTYGEWKLINEEE